MGLRLREGVGGPTELYSPLRIVKNRSQHGQFSMNRCIYVKYYYFESSKLRPLVAYIDFSD